MKLMSGTLYHMLIYLLQVPIITVALEYLKRGLKCRLGFAPTRALGKSRSLVKLLFRPQKTTMHFFCLESNQKHNYIFLKLSEVKYLVAPTDTWENSLRMHTTSTSDKFVLTSLDPYVYIKENAAA